jgi:hypothetical protein
VKLEGRLNTFPLRELLEMILHSSVTGVLNVYWTQGSSQIYFRDGQPYHATSNPAVGVDAIAAIFEHPEASFAFVSDNTSEAESIWGDPLDLIDRAERLAARWQRVRNSVASMDLIPKLVMKQSDVMAYVSREYWPICQGIDGERTLASLAAELAWEPIAFAEAVAQLLAEDAIMLHRPAAVPAFADSPSAATAGKAKGKGLFDRLMANVAVPDENLSSASQPEAAPQSNGAVSANPSDAILRMLRS